MRRNESFKPCELPTILSVFGRLLKPMYVDIACTLHKFRCTMDKNVLFSPLTVSLEAVHVSDKETFYVLIFIVDTSSESPQMARSIPSCPRGFYVKLH